MKQDGKGIIFHIQKFSLHDGPGIRTVVFFKGCPLKCKWCSNPESQSSRIQILWDQEKCIKCGRCIKECPEKAVILAQNGDVFIEEAKCSGCKRCVRKCPGQALQAEGRLVTAEEVIEVCMQDYAFYEESGGGVTLSGGEALMQPDFSLAILQELKKRNIHTAMETTGFASPEVFQKVGRLVDLFLFDLKHWQEEKHKEGTGVTNTLILKNMQEAIVSGKAVLPRLPVIPGYNDSLEDAREFAKKLMEFGAKQVQLLPFHQFGERKYDMLHQSYVFANQSPIKEEELEAYQQVFLSRGLKAFF